MNPDRRIEELENFFEEYARRTNQALSSGVDDIEGTVNAFAECFIGANPNGVMCGKNDESFKAVIPLGNAAYRNMGIIAMNIVSKKISMLDPLHAMTQVTWSSAYVKKNGSKGEIVFDVFYLTQFRDNRHKVFAYITGDEDKALKEAGLI